MSLDNLNHKCVPDFDAKIKYTTTHGDLQVSCLTHTWQSQSLIGSYTSHAWKPAIHWIPTFVCLCVVFFLSGWYPHSATTLSGPLH